VDGVARREGMENRTMGKDLHRTKDDEILLDNVDMKKLRTEDTQKQYPPHLP
jgi:hypothetical protein